VKCFADLGRAVYSDRHRTIVDMDSLEIQVDVNENFINRCGAAASAKLNAYPTGNPRACHRRYSTGTGARHRDGAHWLDQKTSILPEMVSRIVLATKQEPAANLRVAYPAEQAVQVPAPPVTVSCARDTVDGARSGCAAAHSTTILSVSRGRARRVAISPGSRTAEDSRRAMKRRAAAPASPDH